MHGPLLHILPYFIFDLLPVTCNETVYKLVSRENSWEVLVLIWLILAVSMGTKISQDPAVKYYSEKRKFSTHRLKLFLYSIFQCCYCTQAYIPIYLLTCSPAKTLTNTQRDRILIGKYIEHRELHGTAAINSTFRNMHPGYFFSYVSPVFTWWHFV
jgi:hypothetical protein